MAELLALAHVGQHDVERCRHEAERAAGEHHALVVEAAHEHPHAAVLRAEQTLRRHRAVVEHQLAGARAAHAELVELLRGA